MKSMRMRRPSSLQVEIVRSPRMRPAMKRRLGDKGTLFVVFRMFFWEEVANYPAVWLVLVVFLEVHESTDQANKPKVRLHFSCGSALWPIFPFKRNESVAARF